MDCKKILILILVIFGLFQLTYAKEIIASVDIENQSLSDPVTVTEDPYVSDKQDLYGIQIDTTQFTKVEDLTLGDRIEFDIEYFDFKSKKYSKDEHNIVMASVKPSDVLIYIYSEPTQLVLLKGVIKDVDLDSDSIYDIRLRYDGIDSETEYGILNVMRYNDDDYKIYGDKFCERGDVNSEFQCVQVLDKTLGTYEFMTTDTSPEKRAETNQTAEEELIDELSKDEPTVTDTPVEVPEEPIDENKADNKMWLYIGIAVIVVLFVFIIAILIGRKTGGGGKVNFD